MNNCNDYFELTNASHATDKKLLVRGEEIPTDATITWRHVQQREPVFFVTPNSADWTFSTLVSNS